MFHFPLSSMPCRFGFKWHHSIKLQIQIRNSRTASPGHKSSTHDLVERAIQRIQFTIVTDTRLHWLFLMNPTNAFQNSLALVNRERSQLTASQNSSVSGRLGIAFAAALHGKVEKLWKACFLYTRSTLIIIYCTTIIPLTRSVPFMKSTRRKFFVNEREKKKKNYTHQL